MKTRKLFGEHACSKCKYYENSLYGRCYHADNTKESNWMGVVFLKRPSTMNYNRKCEWFKSNSGNDTEYNKEK